ncbi:MAG TPA: hypothetical protein VGM43_14520 [Bryobacteraceae bacterium]|jgi:predicted membrane protein
MKSLYLFAVATIAAMAHELSIWLALFMTVAILTLVIHRVGVGNALHRIGCFCFSARDGWDVFTSKRRELREAEGR